MGEFDRSSRRRPRVVVLELMMRLDDDLLSLLACPVSKQPLVYFPTGDGEQTSPFLFSPAAKLIFHIDAATGFPVLLAEEANVLSDADVAKLTERGNSLGVPTGRAR